MLIVSYFTPDYAEHADRLRQSCSRFGYRHWIQEIEDTRTWEENCALKGPFVCHALEATCDDVLWLDADAEIKRPLDQDELAKHDFAVFDTKSGSSRLRFRSGTVWFNYTKSGRDLAADWAGRCTLFPKVWDQQSLYVSWDHCHSIDPLLRTHWFDISYCQRFDERNGVDNPHIVHYQASRQLKRKAHA